MLSKVVAWIVNTPLHDEQNKILKIQRERLELKTKLQKQRIAEREKRKEKRKEFDERFFTVATVKIEYRSSGKTALAVYDLSTSTKARQWKCRIIKRKPRDDENYWKSHQNDEIYDSGLRFTRTTDSFQNGIEQWVNGGLNLNEVKKYVESKGDRMEIIKPDDE